MLKERDLMQVEGQESFIVFSGRDRVLDQCVGMFSTIMERRGDGQFVCQDLVDKLQISFDSFSHIIFSESDFGCFAIRGFRHIKNPGMTVPGCLSIIFFMNWLSQSCSQQDSDGKSFWMRNSCDIRPCWSLCRSRW